MSERREQRFNQSDIDFLVALITEKLKLLKNSPGLKDNYRGVSYQELLDLIRKIKAISDM